MVTAAGNFTDDGRSYHLSFGIKPLGNSKAMGGVNVSSVKYSLTYVTAGDGYPKGAGARAATTVKRIRLISTGTRYGEAYLRQHMACVGAP